MKFAIVVIVLIGVLFAVCTGWYLTNHHDVGCPAVQSVACFR